MGFEDNVLIRLMTGLLFILAFGTSGLAGDAPSRTAMVQSVLDKNVMPHIQALKESANALPQAVGGLCAGDKPAAHDAFVGAFRRVAEAYASVDFLRFGPMLEGGRRERLFYWPDPRGFLARQLRLVLLNKDQAVLQPGMLAKQSVAVQGLPALEVLATDKNAPLGPGEPARYRCELAHAIAVNVATVAGEIADGWERPGGWKDKMLKPGPDNDTYKNADEPASEFVKALLTGLSLTGDLQMKPQFDKKIRLTPPLSKLGLQKAYYAANVNSLKQLYDALNLEGFLGADKDWVRNWCGGAWRAIISSDGAGGLMPHSIREEAPTPREVFDRMGGLRKLVIGQMTTAAKLTVGFNELDGD